MLYEIAAFLALVLSAVALVVCGILAYTGRRSGVIGLRGDVDELTVVVERLAKASRRERMSAVRQAAPVDGPPPELLQNLPPTAGPLDRKAELRRRLLQGGKR